MDKVGGSSYYGYGMTNKVDKPGRYERNEKDYGTVVATAIAAGDAVADGASAVCSISKEGLSALANAAEHTYDAVSDAATSTVSTVGHFLSDVKSGAEAAEARVEDWVGEGVNDIKSAANYVEDKVSDAAGVVGDAVGSVADAVGSVASEVGDALSTVGGYVGSAVVAGVNAFDNFV